MVSKIFLLFWQFVGSRLLLNLSSYLLTIAVTVCFLKVEAGMMGYRVDSEVHLQTNEDW